MKFNTYDRTPRVKTPKWIKIFLVSFFVFFIAVMLFAGIIMSIYNQSIFPILATVISLAFVAFIASIYIYNVRKAYFEIDENEVKLISYPFFRRREKLVYLHDIKKMKLRFGGGIGSVTYIVFIDQQNKTLFETVNVPEIKSYFEGLGFEIT